MLSDVPDEELDKLSARGLTGLWLIGIWERSTASRRLKQRMGQPDAAASAYSIYDYQVAADLGGEAAVTDLKTRAIQRGIRLSADMVPNHMGIDSRWVIEHPEWFVSVERPPFAVYSFTHENLSQDPARRDLPGRPLLRPDPDLGRVQARGHGHGQHALHLSWQ